MLRQRRNPSNIRNNQDNEATQKENGKSLKSKPKDIEICC